MGCIGHVAWLAPLKPASDFLCLFCLFMDEDLQKSPLPTFLQFVRVRTANQPHVITKKGLQANFHVNFENVKKDNVIIFT